MQPTRDIELPDAPNLDPQTRSDITDLMRHGHWIFQRLSAALIAEMVSRAAQVLGEVGGASVQTVRERLSALPTYRLSALALRGVEKDLSFDGDDGSSILLDCGPVENELPAFWRAVLHSFNSNGYSPSDPSVHYCQPTMAHHRALESALAVLKARLPATHAAMTGWIQRVVVVQGAVVAGSSPRFFGCILMPTKHFERPAAEFAGELVHEMAHQELFVLNAYDRLVPPSADDVLRYSVFAGVRRPTIGRLHAAHALFRMIQVARATDQTSLLLRGTLRMTVRTFRAGDLTPFAQAIVRDVYKAVC